MKRSLTLSFCAIALVACNMSSVRADEIDVTLEFSGGTWQLYAEVNNTAGPADGSVGIAAINALIDNIDFGTNGSAVSLEAGAVNALNPIDQGGPNERVPVLLRASGTVDILYGQDLSSVTSGGVGITGGRAFIASGTYNTGGANPAFGSQGSSVTDGNFLTSTAANNVAIAPDAINLLVNPSTGTGPGDFAGDGIVEGTDLNLLLQFWNQPAGPAWVTGRPVPEGSNVAGNQLNDLLGNWTNDYTSTVTAAAVPEPSTMVIALLASISGLALRRVR